MAKTTTAIELEQVLDEQAAARVLNRSVRTLQDWRHRGGGPEFVKLGRSVGYTPAALRDFIGKCARRSTSDGVATA